MAYDETLARRIRAALPAGAVEEKTMFGGLCFLLGGNMCLGIVKDELMVRVGAQGHEEALAQPHVRPMDFTGKPMQGMVYVAPEGFRSEAAFKGWIERGVGFARSLPPKPPKRPKAPRAGGKAKR
jgi:TfoX/Sxy family transcriptional regulator of competence genes